MSEVAQLSPLDPKGAVITQVKEKKRIHLFSFPLRDYSPIDHNGVDITQVEEIER